MDIGIAATTHHASLVDLLCELGAFYGAPPTDRRHVEEHLADALLGPSSPVTLVVATVADGRVVGFAALVLLPSLVETSGPGRRQCQLKELFVSRAARDQGAGARLLRWSARFALDRGCGRLDWNVQAGNQAGIRFYERNGARLVEDRLSYRVDGDALTALAALGGATGPDQ